MHLDVFLKRGVWIDPPLFFKQVEAAGYGARKNEVIMTLTGKLAREGDRLILTVDDVKPGPQKFVIVKGTSKDSKQNHSFGHAYDEAGKHAGRAVEVDGWWKPPADKKDKNALPTLAVTRVVESKPAERQ